MVSDIRYTPALKLGQKEQLIAVASPLVAFEEHWIDRRSFVCGGSSCPACLVWTNVPRIAFIGKRPKNKGLVLAQLHIEAFGAEDLVIGTVVAAMKDRKRKTVVRPVGQTLVNTVYTKTDVMRCIATMHRLPFPDAEYEQARKTLNHAACEQLRILMAQHQTRTV